jgi:hypothetical protein
MDLKSVLDKHIKDVRFTGVYVYQRDLVYIRAQLNSLNEQGIDHTLMIRYKAGEWGQYMIEAPSIAHCLTADPDLKIMVLIPDGHVHIGSANGFDWELIQGDRDPNSLKAMTDMQVINNVLYAVGMGPMIFQRTNSQWVRFNKGIDIASNPNSISGFKSIAGFKEDKLYVVGFRGEVWYYENDSWLPATRQTNVKLEKVICTSDNQVFACGGNGVLLKGRKDKWELIKQDLTTSTLWGLQEFNKKIYFADSNGIYQYNGDDCIKVDMDLAKELTCGYLHANDGVMWSVGNSHIARYNDKSWEQLF